MRRALAFLSTVVLSTATLGITSAAAAGPTPVLTGDARLDHPISVRPSANRSKPAPNPGGLHIDATFDTSITDSPDSAAIQAGIGQAISVLEQHIATPITVHLLFTSVANGLGGAATYYNDDAYATYRSDLTHQRLSGPDRQALDTLPIGPANPVNGGQIINMTLPLLRATGEAALGDLGVPYDSTVLLNTSIMNLTRSGPQDPAKYDLQQVALHEMIEVLGAGGAGSKIASGQVGTLDLYRFRAKDVRSYTLDPAARPYFSINGGAGKRGYFNQDPGGDLGDWNSVLNGAPRVQDAFSTPGVQVNLVSDEWIALDVVGYELRGIDA